MGGAYVAGISEPNPYSVAHVFLARYSKTGKAIWVRNFATAGSHDYVNALAVDPKGNVILSLGLGGLVDLDPGAGVYRAGTRGASADYILKLTPDADLIWADQFSNLVSVGDVALDARGNPHVIGSFSKTADLNPTKGKMLFTARGGSDVFVEQLSINGKLCWAETFGSAVVPKHSYDPDDDGSSIAVDRASGDVLVGGEFVGTSDVDPNPNRTRNRRSAGSSDLFVTRLNSAGAFVSSVRIGGSGEDWLEDLAVDAAHRVVLTAHFVGTVDVDPGPAVRNFRDDNDGDLLMRLNPDASFGWAKQFYLGSYVPTSLAIGADNSIFATGEFAGQVDFDPGAGQHILKSWSGDFGIEPSDAFVLHLRPGGAFIDAASFGRDSSDSGYDISVDSRNRAFVTGQFAENVDFDPGPDAYRLTAANEWDAFVMQLLI
jgi:hypothetical protein